VENRLPWSLGGLNNPQVNADALADSGPITPDRAGAWASLQASIAQADGTDEVFTADELLEEIDDPFTDFGSGSLAVYDGETMIGYSVLTTRESAEPAHDMRQAGGVHPDCRGRGIGSALLDWSERAAIPLHASRYPGQPLWLSGSCLDTNGSAIDLFSTRGYKQVRWFNLMQKDLSLAVASQLLPDGIEVAGLSPERSTDALLVRNEAFRDHWGSTETSPESWEHLTSSRVTRPQYSFLAYEAGEPLAMVMTQEYEAINDATGERELHLALVATKRAARGRGIASALITTALPGARADGFTTATLSVDADSPTGAVRLYERLGFAVTETWVSHRKELLPA
jgi:mycothiol synthase